MKGVKLFSVILTKQIYSKNMHGIFFILTVRRTPILRGRCQSNTRRESCESISRLRFHFSLTRKVPFHSAINISLNTAYTSQNLSTGIFHYISGKLWFNGLTVIAGSERDQRRAKLDSNEERRMWILKLLSRYRLVGQRFWHYAAKLHHIIRNFSHIYCIWGVLYNARTWITYVERRQVSFPWGILLLSNIADSLDECKASIWRCGRNAW